MRIYLDTCCLNRPFDDQSQERVRLESEAVMLVLSRVQSGEIELLSSTVLVEELSRGPIPDRKVFGEGVLERSIATVGMSELVREAALDLERRWKLDPLDAIHLQAAIVGGASFFLTVDDGILRRTAGARIRDVLVVENPLDWICRRC